MGAVPRAARIRRGREHGHRLLRLGQCLDRGRPLAMGGEAQGDPRRPGPVRRLDPRPRPARRTVVLRPRLRAQGEAHPVDPRERPDPGRLLVGELHDPESHARARRAGRRALVDVRVGAPRGADPHVRA